MKRWMIASCVLATACQATEPQTSGVTQALEDCPKGGNFPDAKMPPLILWTPQTQTPVPTKGQLYMDFPDDNRPGHYLALIVDPGAAQIAWAAIVPNQSMPAYRASRGGLEPMIGDCCRPPPPPIGGDDWNAIHSLEAGKLILEVGERAALHAGAPF